MTQDGPLPPRPTLGERLDAQGRRLTVQLLTTLPWAGPLRVFIDHASGLVVCAGRFDRIERDADRPPRLTATAVRRRPRPDVGSSPGGPPTPVPPGLPLPEAPAARRPTFGHVRRDGRGPAWRPPASSVPPYAGDPLPAAVRSRLRATVGPAADAMRVHHDDESGALAREQRADAVTVGRDVYFRHGRLRPAEQSGFGLLVHEATHVLALLRPGASWHRATGAGARAEEAEALANERAAIFGDRSGAALPPPSTESGHTPDRHPPAPAPAPTQMPVPTAFASPTARPQRAPTDRHTDVTATAPPPLDLQALRRNVIDDVIRQLRTEFERGG
ncbi:DUF4157 domain-containing protein [Streptomyces sp. NBC_01003]|uniref:eCIS core domain-containing protein n=1 Tax=Streptomyces sp. NBC_01003 TaxID=2903714 RepID=UPI00386F9330|nr:DUF4157 domain-containing protein [Streptomyces sp. NBC_01003]